MQELDNKKAIHLKKQLEIENMDESSAKKRLQYNESQMNREKSLGIGQVSHYRLLLIN